jgi:DNA-binding FrmR family transcriptional regulator
MDVLYPLPLAVRVDGALAMDKKVKKKTHVLQQRIQTLRQQLAGARKQMDDPAELRSIEQQLAAAEAELAKVKN